MLTEKIKKANDIKDIDPSEYKQLAQEIRCFLMDKISKTGGHLASNLGAVELTMALHLFLDFPEDKLVWDVGHQSYTHKILTGRQEGFDSLRKYKGLSGFPKRKESDCDACDTGHSSTSISIALGMAVARDIEQKNNKVAAVIGDGALSGGMAYEALNNAARLKSNLMIVLNDNNMSISENVGGMALYLGKIRTNRKYQELKDDVYYALAKTPAGERIADKIKRSKDSIKRLMIPGMLFEDMGLTYIGPIDGHNIAHMMKAFKTASKVDGACIVHVITKKGKGYIKAEENPSRFHGVDPFYVKSGENKLQERAETYTDVYADTMLELAKKRENIVAITAAMPSGTGLARFQKAYPERCFDVGIAEEHAVSFATGLALQGCKPFVAIYSSFLQRAYDQILHDTCINKAPVVFAIDRAGLVGKDGETHQGVFDLSFLSAIPNMTVIAPKNKKEFKEMLEYCADFGGPIAIRYPRGNVYDGLNEYQDTLKYGKSEWIYKEQEIVLVAVGNMVKTAVQVRGRLKLQGYQVSLVNARFVKPIDTEMMDSITVNHKIIVCMEDNVKRGGYGEHVASYLKESGKNAIKMLNISVPDKFVEHGDVDELYKEIGMDADSIVERILESL
ncbi:1-deoxy-D-xylulose-5-phosphate synthase [[Clostridium] polysaccharolyticum]|uniref:1-deoxy-D-xylulose-5-phosphate synthase n=1 Tax=[Clostridium] polysaccharolyticum TaxID=29364 RepID=UPI000B83C98F